MYYCMEKLQNSSNFVIIEGHNLRNICPFLKIIGDMWPNFAILLSPKPQFFERTKISTLLLSSFTSNISLSKSFLKIYSICFNLVIPFYLEKIFDQFWNFSIISNKNIFMIIYSISSFSIVCHFRLNHTTLFSSFI